MLTADACAQSWTDGTSLLNSNLDELTNAILVENLEWVNLEDFLLKICWKE